MKSNSWGSSASRDPAKLSPPPIKSYRRPSLSESETSEFEDEDGSEAGDKKSVTGISDTSNKR